MGPFLVFATARAGLGTAKEVHSQFSSHSPQASNWYGEHLFKLGRLDAGLEEALIAYQLDPLHPGTNAFLGWIYFYLNDSSNTLKYGAAASDLGHASGLYVQAWTNLRIGEFDRAVGLAEQWDERMAEKFDNLQILFTGYVGFDRIDEAFRVVTMALDVDGFDRKKFVWYFWSSNMAPFRQDPRFAALVTEMKMLDYWRDYGWPDVCQPAGDSVICK